jgi:hypothetical protein
MTNLIARVLGIGSQPYKVTYESCASSVTAEIRKSPGLDARVVTLPEDISYCYAHLPIPEEITEFSTASGWELNQGIACMIYSMRRDYLWAPDQKTGARVTVHKKSVDVYSHPKYFSEAVKLAKSLVQKS